MIRITVVSMCLLATSAPAFSKHSYTGNYATCMDKSGGVTAEMLSCIGEELYVQDARLNSVYKKLGSQITPARKQQLTAAQRLWIKYRDANCNYYADPDGGTAEALFSSECVLRETTERANELEMLSSSE